MNDTLFRPQALDNQARAENNSEPMRQVCLGRVFWIVPMVLLISAWGLLMLLSGQP